MFHNISEPMLNRMQFLEKMDAREKRAKILLPLYRKFARLVRRERARSIVGVLSGGAQRSFLHQITPETGRFLALLAGNAPDGGFLEIGTSAGYSALWLTLVCRQRGCKLVTFEVLDAKISKARETFRLAGVEDLVVQVQGDALDYLQNYDNIAFCFLDAAKEIYLDCYETVVPKLAPGGLLVADNILSHKEDVQPLLARAMNDERVDASVVPVGAGLLICRKAEHPGRIAQTQPL